jgi:(p)ppGpp synthase/HD superfamily hydrolase
MWRESIDGIANFWNHDKDETAKNKMQYSLENDFPFYNDLARLSRNYEKGEYSDNTFYEKVKKLILPRRINIKMVGYNHKQTYDGCTIKDLIISIHPNIIRSDVEYYINGELKDINYQLKDGDFFEEKIREIKDSEFVRKRK